MAKLCLNMIVKNEADKIVRCLKSVAPVISCYAILDTGSTDGTQKVIEEFFAEKKIPGVVKQGRFENFEQARNDGLALARGYSGDFDYIFLLDADMDLQIADPKAFDNLTDISYDMLQTAGGVSYYNRRLVRRDQKGGYIGVTHEYLNINGGSKIAGAYFIDHADGTNRKDKYVRDIKLLLPALQKEPNNGRYMYYLAQSFRDAGRTREAAEWYRKRAEAGGWDEEAWSARLNLAHCLKGLDDEGGFIRELLAAYNFRPTRAEPLYDLARFYREKGEQNSSLLFSAEGMKIPYPTDVLFVTDHVYGSGMREEFSICAFYNPRYREQGYNVCSELAVDVTAPAYTRELARNNLFHYIKPLKELCPSFKDRQILYVPPDSYISLNPSVTSVNGKLRVMIRTVNYYITPTGQYAITGSDGTVNNTNPIHTRNFLGEVDDDLRVHNIFEIALPTMPAPAWPLVIGFEDMRIFEWKKELWSLSNLRQANPEGWCEQHLARLEPWTEGYKISDDYKRILPKHRQHEKNWMPWVNGDDLSFVYKVGAANIDLDGELTLAKQTKFATEALSGGSQVIPFRGGWIALIHESKARPGDGQRYYQHRFAFWDNNRVLRNISKAFVIYDKQIEFGAGMAWHPDGKHIVISYGIRDKEAWLATIDWLDIASLLANNHDWK